jgi:hypothetical protein
VLVFQLDGFARNEEVFDLVFRFLLGLVRESEIWTNSRRHDATPSIAVIFRGPFARLTMLLTLLSFATIFAYWGFNGAVWD